MKTEKRAQNPGRSFQRSILAAPFFAAAWLSVPTVVSASFLAPGGSTFTPTAFGAGSLPGTFIAELLPIPAVEPFPVVVSPAYTGLLNSMVMLDSSTGFLNFLYQVTNNAPSADTLTQARIQDFYAVGSAAFGGTALDVGYISGVTLAAAGITGAPTKPVGTVAPSGFSRTASGARVNALFLTDEIDPGEVSNWLVVRTNATTDMIRIGSGTVIDGTQSNVVAVFAPVPEPTTALFGGALTMMCLAGRRRRQSAA